MKQVSGSLKLELAQDFLDILITYFFNKIDEEQRCQYLQDLSLFIAKDKKFQIALIDYVNNNMFTKHQKWKVYSLLK